MMYVVVDVETNGPIPGDYSMLSLGAVIVDKSKRLNTTFYAELKPLSKKFKKENLKFSGLIKTKTIKRESPKLAMKRFVSWIKDNCREKPVFISDNNGFDWMFVCWYLWHFVSENPFGYSSRGLSSMYRGMIKNMNKDFDNLRNRTLSHNALDDAKNNAELFIKLVEDYKLII